jgi:hypothetical protein
LTRLFLKRTAVTDLSALTELANLRMLWLQQTGISSDQVEAIKRANPDLTIYRPEQ